MTIAPSTSPTLGETPLHAIELFERSNDCIVRNTELDRDGDRGQRVLNIVPPGNRHVHLQRKRRSPSLSRIRASKRVPLGTGVTFSARTSASAEKP